MITQLKDTPFSIVEIPKDAKDFNVCNNEPDQDELPFICFTINKSDRRDMDLPEGNWSIIGSFTKGAMDLELANYLAKKLDNMEIDDKEDGDVDTYYKNYSDGNYNFFTAKESWQSLLSANGVEIADKRYLLLKNNDNGLDSNF